MGGVLLTVARVLCVAFLAALAVAPSASSSSPCGQKILADWNDNQRIDRLYPLPCYQEAIEAIPADLLPYADADEVIGRALQAALRRQGVTAPRAPGAPAPPSGETPAPPTSAPPVNTSATTSVPLPLLVLGSCALVLLTTGGLGWLVRRRRDAAAT